MEESTDLTQLEYRSWPPWMADLRRKVWAIMGQPNATSVASSVQGPAQNPRSLNARDAPDLGLTKTNRVLLRSLRSAPLDSRVRPHQRRPLTQVSKQVTKARPLFEASLVSSEVCRR
jgi:hypothetical protein